MISISDEERLIARQLALSDVPEHLHDGLRNYLAHGLAPGSFLTAVLCNDLTQAVARGSAESCAGLPAIVRFLWNSAPATAWGDAERVGAWLESMRLTRRVQ